MPIHKHLLVLTGSGISAESGISTFRDVEGLWAQFDVQKLATPEGFQEDPALVHEWYNLRRNQVREVQPNAAHYALARLQFYLKQEGGSLTIVTQNVDDLHERAGADVIHMHGEILKATCSKCSARRFMVQGELSIESACKSCGSVGGIRPDVVWFGEMPYHMERIRKALSEAEMFVSIGTSGSVYPAAGFVAEANSLGRWTAELNLEPSENASDFREAHYGPASEVVPKWVEQWGV